MTGRAALIAKLEAATEGSRELDCMIGVHPATPSCGVNKGARVAILLDDRCFGISSPDGERDCAEYLPKTNADALGIPHFTTSIDAALTLVQRGWFIVHAASRKNGTWFWGLGCDADHPDAERDGRGGTFSRDVTEEGATPALALCIAVLKAPSAPAAQTRDRRRPSRKRATP